MSARVFLRLTAAVLSSALLTVAGCSSDTPSSATVGSSMAASTTIAPTTETTAATPTTDAVTTDAPTTTVAATTTTAVQPLVILVTNDDGIGAPGIDALVTALAKLPDVTLVIVAPAENQSGSSDTTSSGAVLSGPGATISGVSGTAVQGTPADSVNVALDELGITPDVVVSGANATQNIGIFVPLSGTVGAARTAARRGIPAIAVSAGGLADQDFVTAAELAATEVTARRATLGFSANTDHTVVNLNSPTCAAGTAVRGIVDVPVATEFPAGTNGLDLVFDCASTATDPSDDAVALTIGFATRSIVAADL